MTSDIPRHLIFELTGKCNYHCPFCYCVWHENPALSGRDLPTGEWREIINGAIVRGVNNLLFSGGEAMLRPDIHELTAYARKLVPDAEIGIFTNGSRVTEKDLRRFRRQKINISVSLPGLATYAAMTGTRRKYYHTLALIARAKELKHPVGVSLTATRLNLAEFPQIFCAALISGARYIQAGAVMFAGRAACNPELMISRKQWEEVKTAIRALPDLPVPYTFNDEMICDCNGFLPQHLQEYGLSGQPPCTAGRDFGVIGPDGCFRKCLHTAEPLCHYRKLFADPVPNASATNTNIK